MTTTNDFTNSLIDVRKAYRLLFLYQKRVMELVQFMGDTLSFSYQGGWSRFSSNTPRNSKGSLDNWSWDWLNMYFYEFNFAIKEIDKNKIKFSILLQSDTGYYDSQSDSKVNVESFLLPENSETKIIFLVGKNCWHPDFENDFEDTNAIYKKELLEYVKTVEEKTLLAKSFLLTDFINLDTTQNALMKWVEFCNENGISQIEMHK